MIEIGRHRKIPKEIRFCPFCQNSVETEIHFLFHCPIYNTMRVELFNIIITGNNGFYFYTTEEKLDYIMTHIDNQVAKFINLSFELRTFLLSHPKMKD